jgi:hypothetical protein
MKWAVILVIFVIYVMSLAVMDMMRVCPPTVTQEAPSVIVEVEDPSLEQFATRWRAEVARRFPNAVVALCHGGTFVEGQWITGVRNFNMPTMPIPTLIAHLQKEYPGRPVVLLCCNPSHITLHGYPDVWYAADSVWCVPDRSTMQADVNVLRSLDDLVGSPEDRWAANPGVVGSIFEFVEAR